VAMMTGGYGERLTINTNNLSRPHREPERGAGKGEGKRSTCPRCADKYSQACRHASLLPLSHPRPDN